MTAHKQYEGPSGRVEAWPEDGPNDKGKSVAGVGWRTLDRKSRGWATKADFAAAHTGDEPSTLAPPFKD